MLNARERRAAALRREVRNLVDELGGPTRVASLLGVSLDTARRWHEERVTPSPVVKVALCAHLGRLPGMDESKWWRGWRFGQDGYLWGPHGKSYTEGHLYAAEVHERLAKFYQGQIELLKAKLREAEGGLAANDPVEGELRLRSQSR